LRDEQGWLDEDRIELALKMQEELISRSDGWMAQQRHLLALQQQADILLELISPDELQVLHDRFGKSFTKSKFPVSDLQNCIALPEPNKPIALVVILVQSMFVKEAGKPDELDLLRNIDAMLYRYHVKTRMVQVFCFGCWFLDKLRYQLRVSGKLVVSCCATELCRWQECHRVVEGNRNEPCDREVDRIEEI